VSRLADEGGFATLVLHLPMLDWWGEQRLDILLARLAEARLRDEVWLAPCAEIAAHVLARPGAFDATTLDPTTWDG
jgi:hypothetical protein